MADALYLGVEIGGTKLQLALGRGDGQLLALERRVIRPEAGAEGIRRQIVEMYPALLDQLNAGPEAILAAGIGFGGPVDSARGLVSISNQIQGWKDFPLADWLRTSLDIPAVHLNNDADTAALGEALHGAGVGFSPVLYVTIGSGIGGGLIVDGQIYRGNGTGSVEIGHLWVRREPQARLVHLEEIASGWSIAAEARRQVESSILSGQDGGLLHRLSWCEPERITTALVADAAGRGDKMALSVLKAASDAFSLALAQSINLLAPRRIILGGGVSLIGDDLWFDPIRKSTDQLVFAPIQGTYDIVPATLGEEVVLHGALALASG